MDAQAFHRTTAEELARRYAAREDAPEGWRETLTWHWEQAGAYQEALIAALDVTEARVSELAFADARRWAERVLMLLDRLDNSERRRYEMRAYALTISVLEFGGQYREALGYARLLMRMAEERGNVEALGRAHLAIGRVQRELGQLTVAEAEMVRALALAERHSLAELETEVRLQLAKVHQLQGRHLLAFQQLELAQDTPIDDRSRLARVCTSVGDVYRVLGAGDEALRFYHRALKLEIGSTNRLGQAMLYEKLGLSNLELDQVGVALQCAREALRLREDLGDVVGQARSHSLLGAIQSRLGNHQTAMEHFERSRDLDALSQNQRGMSIALTNLGDAARALGDNERARAHYVEALTLARQIDDQIALARMYQRLGDLSFQEGDRETTRAYWSEALRIRERLGHSEEAIALRGRMAAAGIAL